MGEKEVSNTATTASVSPEDARLVREVTAVLLNGAIASGELSFKGKSADEIKDEVKRFLRLAATGAITILPVIDYRDDLLREARVFLRHSKWDLALLLYATYFEHAINGLLVTQARRRHLNKHALVQMLREVSFSGKTSWLLEVFEMKPINHVHRQKLLKLTEARNSFVHYKWLPKSDSDAALYHTDLDPVIRSLKDIEKTVSYFRRYEDRMFYGGQRKHIRPAVSTIGQSKRTVS
jgi:hypothetical protein